MITVRLDDAEARALDDYGRAISPETASAWAAVNSNDRICGEAAPGGGSGGVGGFGGMTGGGASSSWSPLPSSLSLSPPLPFLDAFGAAVEDRASPFKALIRARTGPLAFAKAEPARAYGIRYTQLKDVQSKSTPGGCFQPG